MTPTISVIIPTYQRGELLRDAIESVEAQSYRDFELIVIDDGSTDGTGEMVESLGGWDGRLRYRWQRHRGVSAARNAGLRLARGEIAVFSMQRIRSPWG
jgi:glycosyltransferase involved in cell wall biosynthesis